jgi:2-haloacid dehalogenase
MTNQGLDYTAFDALTFDCYGTLIDWEAGILAGLRAALGASGADPTDDDLLEVHSRAEATAEAGPYRRYRQILASCFRDVCRHFGGEPGDASAAAFGGSVADWPAFADSAQALRLLQSRYRLGVITNCDDDLFAASNRRLGVTFDWVVTAQAVRSYKPDPRNFDAALAAIGLPTERILHVAQSLFHDHVPAKAIGMSTVWIDRRHDRPGFGATPPATVIPDAVFPDMASFAAAAIGANPGGTRQTHESGPEGPLFVRGADLGG